MATGAQAGAISGTGWSALGSDSQGVRRRAGCREEEEEEEEGGGRRMGMGEDGDGGGRRRRKRKVSSRAVGTDGTEG